MSLKAVVELVLRLESYYIVEYPHQCLFSFRTSIYQLKEGKKNYAIPYQVLENSHPQPTQFFSRTIVEPATSDEHSVSSTAIAKFSDEEIAFDNWFSYRMELQGYPQLDSDDIFMDVELWVNYKEISEPQSQGQMKEKVTFRLNDIENGIFSYVEAHFKAPYLSKLNCTLLTFVSAFKFAKYDPGLKKQLQKEEKMRMKVKSVQELAKLAEQSIPKEVNVTQLFYTSYVKKLRISQYLMQQRFNSILEEPGQPIIKVPQQFKKDHGYLQITQKQLKEYLDNYKPEITIDDILQQINTIRQQNFDVMHTMISFWMEQKVDHDKLVQQFDTFGKEKYGQMVFKSVIGNENEQQKKKIKSYHENKKIAQQMRGKNIVINSYPIEDVKFIEKREEQQLVFYEVTPPQYLKHIPQIKLETVLSKTQQEQLQILTEGMKLQYSQKNMLVVLCHGYQGSSYDMTLIKRWIQLQMPQAYYLVSKSNQYDTDGDIKNMGMNLAEEIEKYIKNYLEEYEQENVIINLVGHSMGGIIARSAIPHLEKYKHHMGFFCSLSSPHLGYLNGVSSLIKVGLWAIRKFKNIKSLQQLSMEEKGDPRKTFLYQLSKTGHLKYFRKVILLSSFEDSYVSWHSARISTHRSKNSQSKIQKEMINNIMAQNIFGSSVHRIDINFNVKEKTLDSFIGRTAHINLIVRQNLFKTMSITIPKLFDLTEFGKEGIFM